MAEAAWAFAARAVGPGTGAQEAEGPGRAVGRASGEAVRVRVRCLPPFVVRVCNVVCTVHTGGWHEFVCVCESLPMFSCVRTRFRVCTRAFVKHFAFLYKWF